MLRDPIMERKFGVHSEVGKLRTVMVCRPGLAHQRLTPGNCHDLLFDDVIWVHEAQKDHYDFVLKMKERDVEVLELHDLLSETLDDAVARAWILDRRITPNTVGRAITRFVRPWLDEMPAAKLAEHLIGGIALEDLPKSESSGLLLEVLGGTSFLIPPIPNSLFQRDPSCWIYGGVTCNPMFWPARGRRRCCSAPSTNFTRSSRAAISRSGSAIPTRISLVPASKAATSCRSATASC
jgi:arginine deiminase